VLREERLLGEIVGPFAHGNHAILTSLAAQDQKLMAFEAKVADGKVHELTLTPAPAVGARARSGATRNEAAFFQAVRAILAKRAPGETKPEEELDIAVRHIVSRAVASGGVIDIFAAAGLKKPDVSILSEESLAEVREMPQRNLAVKLLRKLLLREIQTRRRKNVVQARFFAEMLEQTIRRYQNRAIEAAQVIEELLGLAKEMRQANERRRDARPHRG
jgi:type I site-specific restriction-modification system R (restriction) subunit